MVTNYNNVPVYQGMFASKIESSKILSGKRLSGEIENELIDEIGVTKLDGISCYEKPNTDIIITINITNPKSYEILSFTLMVININHINLKRGQIQLKFLSNIKLEVNQELKK